MPHFEPPRTSATTLRPTQPQETVIAAQGRTEASRDRWLAFDDDDDELFNGDIASGREGLLQRPLPRAL